MSLELDTLRPCGFVPSSEGYEGAHGLYATCRGAAGYASASLTRDHFQPTGDVEDQGALSKCVGTSTADAMSDRLTIQGSTPAKFSDLWGYYGARLYAAMWDHGLRGEAAAELAGALEGCSPERLMAYLLAEGFCLRDAWPPGNALESDRPPPSAMRGSYDQRKLLRQHRIYGADHVREALAQGLTITVAGPIDRAYSHYDGGVWPGVTGPVIGNHQRRIVGYDRMGRFVEKGSWGVGHGMMYEEASNLLCPPHEAPGGFLIVSEGSVEEAREIHAFEWASNTSEQNPLLSGAA